MICNCSAPPEINTKEPSLLGDIVFISGGGQGAKRL